MAAMFDSLQRHFFPVLIISICTGLLALIPGVGWLLGFAVFVLGSKYIGRNNFFPDLAVAMVLWVVVRQLAMLL
jgi:hypothetical protein